MSSEDPSDWTEIYQTRSSSDADLVRTTLEVAGFKVSIQGGGSPASFIPSYDGPAAITISVPTEDADDAREFLKHKTSLLPTASQAEAQDEAGSAEAADQPESMDEAVKEILELRRGHHVAACRYCGIPTLDVGEQELDSHKVVLLRSAGLGVNSATFSDFQPGERICSECAGHEVTCELCGRALDAFLDEGDYRRANDDEAYVCAVCRDRLDDQLTPDRDW
jgi:hypothetical protein